jgi:hypothetical protein
MVDQFLLDRPKNSRWVAAQSIAEEFSSDFRSG